jgi:hypothetical protein
VLIVTAAYVWWISMDKVKIEWNEKDNIIRIMVNDGQAWCLECIQALTHMERQEERTLTTIRLVGIPLESE